jgi:hypothetical protein
LGVRSLCRKLHSRIRRFGVGLIAAGADPATCSQAALSSQQSAQFRHAVDALLAQDVVDARLSAHVRGHAPELADPLARRAHHLRQLLRPDDNQGDETNHRNLQK